MRRLAVGVGLLALAGCGAGSRPTTPSEAAVVAPVGWRASTMAATDRADPLWWRRFGDPALAEVVGQALAHNDDIAVAAGRVDEARAQFRLARSSQLPTINVGRGGDRDRSVNAFGMGVDQSAGQAEILASFDLDLFGRLAKASKAARAQLLATEDARDNVRLAVAASAATGYVMLCAYDARLKVLRDTLAARKVALKLTQRRAEAGYASRLDLSQAEAEYEATAQLIPAAELAIARQEDGLGALLGRMPGPIDRGLLDRMTLPDVPLLVPLRLIERRPDLAAAASQIVAADHALDSARAAFLPDVQLGASGGAVASTLLGDPISIFSIGSSILAPLLEGGRLRAQADAAAARRDQAAFNYRRIALAAFREVEDGLATVARSREQEGALVRQRDALGRALGFAGNRYREGYSPYLELLDAQRASLSAELALVQSRADRLT
ncbi:MAG: efflux transporter outer membrane subunit, partial [Janthinobacterium lividum]